MQNAAHDAFMQLRLLSSPQVSSKPLPEVLRQGYIKGCALWNNEWFWNIPESLFRIQNIESYSGITC